MQRTKQRPRTACRILIVDDHAVVREGLRAVISQQRNLSVCAEAESFDQALEAAREDLPDVAIVDLSLKKGAGLELVKAIRQHSPETRILVFSVHDELIFAERVVRAGALGYVMKQETSEHLLKAIRAVQRGEIYLSERMSTRLVRHYVRSSQGKKQPLLKCLSDRELEVFQLVGYGVTTRQIAEQLHLSVKTIETHRAHIMEKLQLHSAIELVRCAARWSEDEA